MWIHITCSCCGKHRRISDNHPEQAVSAARAGWRSHGTALYCPDCVKTWHERNTKALCNELDTCERILVFVGRARRRRN